MCVCVDNPWISWLLLPSSSSSSFYNDVNDKKNLLLLTMFTMTMMKYPSLSLCLLLKNIDEHRYNLVSFMIYISILLKWFWFFYTIQKTAVFLFGFVDLPMKTINLWQFLMDVFESFFFSLFLSLFIWLGQVFNSHKVNEHTFNKPVFFIFVTYNNNDFFPFFWVLFPKWWFWCTWSIFF